MCGRFVARDATLCSRCEALAPHEDGRLHLGLVALPDHGELEPTPERRTGSAIGTMAVIRAGRPRCAECGRFVASTETYCDRHRPKAIAAADPLRAAVIPATDAIATPELPPSARARMYEQTRSDFIVPRPNQLHPEQSQQQMGARGQLLPHIAPSPDNSAAPDRARGARRRPAWWGVIPAAAGRQRIAMMVILGAAVIGVAVAMLVASR
jgi:hypothetical protein